MRVIIVDPSVISREGLRLLLDAESDLRVVGLCHDLASGVVLARRLAPDVIVVDPRAGRPGVDAIASLRRASPDSRLIALIDHDEAARAEGATATHVSDYVSRMAASPSDVLRVMRGGGSTNRRRTSRYGTPPRRLGERAPTRTGTPLTPRELEILQCLADGGSNKEIAKSLGISPETVKSHLRQLFQKLEVADRAEAVSVALRRRLVG